MQSINEIQDRMAQLVQRMQRQIAAMPPAPVPAGTCPTCLGSKTVLGSGGGFEPCPDCLCPTCGGIGFLRVDVELGHPLFGQTVPCSNPHCPTLLGQAAARQTALRRYCGLPSGYENMTFATFDALPDEAKDGKQNARMAAELFAMMPGHALEIAGAVRNWLILHGPCGTGKTGMVSAVAAACMEAGEQVLYIRTPDLFEAIQKRYNRDKSTWDDEFGDDTSEDVLDRAKRAPLLVLDEMDVAGYKISDNKQDIMEKILRYRHNEGLPLLGTTNLSPREFLRWGERSYSVVEAKTHWVLMDLPSLRDGLAEWSAR